MGTNVEIRLFAIHPSYRKRGLMKQSMRLLCDIADKEGITLTGECRQLRIKSTKWWHTPAWVEDWYAEHDRPNGLAETIDDIESDIRWAEYLCKTFSFKQDSPHSVNITRLPKQ
jgi:hypothetical protein